MKTFADISNGVVSNTSLWPDTATPSASQVDITSVSPQPGTGWTYANGAFTAPAQPAPAPQTSAQARAAGEAYVNQFFTDLEITELEELLLSPSTPANQLAMVKAVKSWLSTIETAWLASPATFNPTTFGNPPNTYAEILTMTN